MKIKFETVLKEYHSLLSWYGEVGAKYQAQKIKKSHKPTTQSKLKFERVIKEVQEVL